MKTIEQVRKEIALTPEQKRMLQHAFSLINKVRSQGVRVLYDGEEGSVYAYNAEKWEIVENNRCYINIVKAKFPLQHIDRISNTEFWVDYAYKYDDIDWIFNERKD